MTDERRTVIRDIIGNSNESDKDENSERDEEEEEVSGVTLPTTLVSSLLLTLNTLLIYNSTANTSSFPIHLITSSVVSGIIFTYQ